MNENPHQLEKRRRTFKEMQTSLFIILVNKIIIFNKNFKSRIILMFLLRLYHVYNAYAMFIQNAIVGVVNTIIFQ